MFFFLLMVAVNDSTRAVFTSGMKNLREDAEQMEPVRSGGVPLEQVVEEFVRDNPPFAYMRRSARATPSSAVPRSAGETSSRSRDPNPHVAFAGGGHSAWGPAWRGWSSSSGSRRRCDASRPSASTASATAWPRRSSNQYRSIPVTLEA
jgi:hypothetical protein